MNNIHFSNPLASITKVNRRNLEASMKKLAAGDTLIDRGKDPLYFSISEKFARGMSKARAVQKNADLNLGYLRQQDSSLQVAQEILGKMYEISGAATDPLKTDEDRHIFDLELKSLTAELNSLSRNSTFQDKQLLSREVVCSFDSASEKMVFWQTNDFDQQRQLEIRFDATATDSKSNLLNFDPSHEWTMSRDGKSLLYLDTSNYLCRYDIDQKSVSRGSSTYGAGTNLTLSETGNLYLNDNGSLVAIKEGAVEGNVIAGISMTSQGAFSVYSDKVTYKDSTSGDFHSFNLTTLTDSFLANDTHGVGTFASQAMSGSGKWIAGLESPTRIRLTDTITGSSSVLDLPPSVSVAELKISENGDTIYFVDNTENTLNKIDIDFIGKMSAAPVRVAHSSTGHPLNGLSVSGSAYSSNFSYHIDSDGLGSLAHSSADISAYSLKLIYTDLTSLASATTAMGEIKNAINSVALAQTRTGSKINQMERILFEKEEEFAEAQMRRDAIRNPDIAKESAELSRNQINTELSMAMSAHQKAIEQRVLGLLTN